MSRRLFIRGLVVLGVSVGAAVTYADALSAKTPTPAIPAADIYDHYPDDTGSGPAVTGADVGAGQAARSGAATPVRTRPNFTG